MPNQNLTKGVLSGAIAGALWGIVFIAPLVLQNSSPLAITIARYGWYGLLSLILLAGNRKALSTLRTQDVMLALFLALTGSVGYYFALAAAIRAIGAVIPTLVIGTLPLTIAIAGNLRSKEMPFRSLVIPFCLIFFGLIALNFDQMLAMRLEGGSDNTLRGWGWALLALLMWTAYGVVNAEFLKRRPEVSSAAWSSICGVATLPFLIVCLPFVGHWSAASDLPLFLVLTFSMGILSSWGAMFFWNNASALLPTGLTGQLVVFETIFGLLYTFLWETRLPTLFEIIGITFLLAGVLKGVSVLRERADSVPLS